MSFLSALGDAFNTVTLHQFDSSVKPTQSQQDAAARGDAARTAANTVSTSLGQNYHGEYIPQTVAQLMENFDGMSHDDIIKYQGSIDVQGLGASVDAWNNIAKDLGTKCGLFKGAIEGELNNGWSGATANAAKTSVRNFAEDMNTLTNAAQMVASKINDATATLTQVKNQIPGKPSNPATSVTGILTDVAATAIGAGGATLGSQFMANHGRQTNAQNEARDVMNNVYKKYVPDANTQVPKMPGVSQTDKNAGGASGPSSPAQSSVAPSSYQSNGNTYGPSNSSSSSDSGNSNGSSYGSSNGYSYSGTSSGNSTSPSSLNLPDATSGLSSSMGNNTATAGYSPSGTGTTGTTGGGGYDASTGGSAGSSVPGTASTAAKTANAATAGTTSSKNTSSLGGMPHAGKKDGEGDSEHKTPDYLKGIQEELVGPEPKLLPGGVIGGDYAE